MNLLRVSKNIKNIIFYFIVFSNIVVFSQNKVTKSSEKKNSLPKMAEEEVIKATKEYISKKEFDKASFFLSKYYKSHSESLSINWLYAFVYSLNNENKKADKKFLKALSISPSDINLQKDYARFLYGIGKIDKLTPLLKSLINEDPNEVEFLLMQANISFWKGDVENAKLKINEIQKIYSNTDITKNLEDQIKELTALYLKTEFEYQSDSQPLVLYGRHLTLSKYFSPLLNPQIETSSYIFSSQLERALSVKLSNQFLFDKLKLSAKLSGGVYVNYAANADWIGGLTFSKKLFKNTSLNFGYTKNSLLGTIKSTTFNLTQQDVFGNISYQNKFIELHAGYNHKFFTDKNVIKSIGNWIVSQPINIKKFNFQVGYGYSFTDSENILFIFDNQGLGVYDPYFTPKEQEIHSLILMLNYNPTSKISIKTKLNYGIQATVKNPYRIQIRPNNYEIGGFYDETFNFAEFNSAINYYITNNFGLNANYTYQNTFFYKRDNINLGLNYKF